MQVNQLSVVGRSDSAGIGYPEQSVKTPVKSLVLKIFGERRTSCFEETLLIAFLKGFKVDFTIDVSAVPTFRGHNLPLLVANGKHIFDRKTFPALAIKLLDLPRQNNQTKYLLRNYEEVCRAMQGLEFLDTSQRQNPYSFIVNPVLHLFYRSEKDEQRAWLEDSGITSSAKACRVIFTQLAEFSSQTLDEDEEGTVFLRLFCRTILNTLRRNFEELIVGDKINELANRVEFLCMDPPGQTADLRVPLEISVWEVPPKPEKTYGVIKGLPLFVLACYGLYTVFASKKTIAA